MTKVTQSISLDFDDWEVINEVRTKFKQKNHSQSIHTIIKQWLMFMEERKIITTTPKEKPQIEQRSHGIPPLPDKYKLKSR